MKKRFKEIYAATLLAVGLVGCASEEDNIVIAPVPEVDNQFELNTHWDEYIGEGAEHYFSKFSPKFAYGKFFAASRDGEVKAIDPASGDTIWSTDLTDSEAAEREGHTRLSGGIAAAYGKIYIGTENGQVIAFSEEGGDELWRVDVPGEVLSSPIAESNLIIINTTRGVLIALDEETGDQKWVINTEVPNLTLRGDSTPIASSGGVFWGTANGRLAAALVENGQLLWQQPIGTPKGATEIARLVDVDASPIILGRRLFIIGYNGQLTSINLQTGETYWKRQYSSATNMATDGRSIYLVTDKDHIVAVDSRSGTQLWKNEQLEYRLLTAPKRIKGHLVVGDSEGYLYWLNLESGEFMAKQSFDDSGFSVSPVLVEDGFIVMTRDGELTKLSIKEPND
ncbi:outer membrane protein assembly factor BamB [Vibrio sp.]|nr:outer membrane protein assembly factor BamB [Vibrio sp.]